MPASFTSSGRLSRRKASHPFKDDGTEETNVESLVGKGIIVKDFGKQEIVDLDSEGQEFDEEVSEDDDTYKDDGIEEDDYDDNNEV